MKARAKAGRAEAEGGGTNSAGQSQYIYLPTANWPMPIAAIVNGNTYAVHSDHLNTPRKLTDASGQAAWQWSYSAFGEDKPTLAKNRFANLETSPNGYLEVMPSLRGGYGFSGIWGWHFAGFKGSPGKYITADPGK